MQCVNHNHPTIDGKGLIHGRPAYADDLAEANSLIVKVLRSPHAFAKIIDIDLNGADKIPGVECILTHKDFERVPVTRAGQGYPEPSPHDKFVIDNVVRYVGDEVLAVAAMSVTLCEEALSLIKVTYEVLEPVLDFEKAYMNPSIIHDEEEAHEMFPIGFEPKKNVAATYLMDIGNVDESFKKCDVVVHHTFYTQAQAHAMMEPHNVNARLDFQGRLVLITSTQTPYHT
jgi:CO/xanthine dehydrogenase Mo-binding subunit